MKSAFDLLKDENRKVFDTLKDPKPTPSRIINTREIIDPIIEEISRDKEGNVSINNADNITNPIVDTLEKQNANISNLLNEFIESNKVESKSLLERLKGVISDLTKARDVSYTKELKELSRQNKELTRAISNIKLKQPDVNVSVDIDRVSNDLVKLGKKIDKLAKRENTVVLPPLAYDVFADSAGNKRPALINSDGILQVGVSGGDPLAKYAVAEVDKSTSTKYVGFVDVDGNWYIMRAYNNTYRYTAGSTNFVTNWGDRASLVYDYLYNVF